MRKDEKTYGKPSDSYEKRWENVWQTIRFLWEKMRKPMVNHQIPMRKDEKTYDKPSDSYEKRWENL